MIKSKAFFYILKTIKQISTYKIKIYEWKMLLTINEKLL